jgi:predicted Zn-dependent peptidase
VFGFILIEVNLTLHSKYYTVQKENNSVLLQEINMWDPYAEMKHVTLPNGLSVYLGTWDRPWIMIKILVHAGAKDDLPGKDGTAHFLEHLLSENVPGFSYEEICHRFGEIGVRGKFGSTAYTTTSYGCSVPLEGNSLEFALNIFGNMLITCDIHQLVERERSVILNEYNERFPTELHERIMAARRKAFFEGKGLELKGFLEFLSASPFGIMKPGSRNPYPEAMSEVDHPSATRFDVMASDLGNFAIHQSSIELHTVIPGVTDDQVVGRAMNTLCTIFNREIRERRGWSYGLGVEYYTFPEAYEFLVTAKFPWENLPVMEDLLDECIEIAINSPDVINRHIRGRLNSFKIHDPDGEEVVKHSASDLERKGRILTYADELERAKRTTVEEVKEALGYLARHRRFTVTLKP